MKTETKIDIYETITAKIVAQLEAGVRPWHKPWQSGRGDTARPQRVTGESYNGVNILILWMAAEARGFSNSTWMTFNQARELGGCVRKGEKGTMVVYAGTFEKTTEDDNGDEKTKKIPFLKTYYVFNVQQIDGLPESFTLKDAVQPSPFERIEAAEAFFVSTGADIRHGGDRAFFQPASDHIQMPAPESFESSEDYYGTLAHEAIHWSGHDSRLARTFGKRFGDEAYAMEELVAELGAAFVAADLAIENEVREDHASYLASWLKILKADKRAIFTASAAASRAAEYLSKIGHPATVEA